MSVLYQILLNIEFILAVPIFILLFFISAPYGKFIKSGWGPAMRAPLAWFLMELPVVALPVIFFFTAGRPHNLLTWTFIIIWEIHYVRRTFLYPALMNKSAQSVPFLIILFSAVFNLINGYTNGYGIYCLQDFGTVSLLSWNFIAGIIIFIGGFIITITSDHILHNLRAPGETGYKIPRKGLFRWVSSPHYLGEILEWTGWAILTWSPAGAAFLVFTIANLAPRAYSNLKWYREKFPDYPANRRALIPFIF